MTPADSSPLVVSIDDAQLASSLWRAPFLVRHNLSGHPLLSRDALARLTAQCPASSVLMQRSDRPVVGGDNEPAADCTAAEAAADIEHSRSWVGLSFIDQAEGYGELVDTAGREFRSRLASSEGLRARNGTLFLASPDGVTSAHYDRHHNILLQIEGTKELSVGEFDDVSTAEWEIARGFSGGEYISRLPTRFRTFALGPGDGIYIPPYAPHWVVGGHNVCIALSCSVRTEVSHRVELAHIFNTKLRRIGLRPVPPGTVPGRDAAKAATMTAWWAGRRAARNIADRLPPAVTRWRGDVTGLR